MNINITNFSYFLIFFALTLLMLMHAIDVLCNEPWCCIFCWQFDMHFSYATHLAHPVLCRPTHLKISGYASASNCIKVLLQNLIYMIQCKLQYS